MTFIVKIEDEAYSQLNKLVRHDPAMGRKFIVLVDELERCGPWISQVKKLSGTRNGWRFRFGRYRAIFTFDNETITIWFIDIEKDTKKDYQRWIPFLKQRGIIE